MLDYGWFNPVDCSISIDIKRLRLDYPITWKKQLIGLYAHELIHLFEWLFVYRKSINNWNDAINPERFPDFIQDSILRLIKL